MEKKIEIMEYDTVMVNKPQESLFSAVEKLTIAQLLLEELNVDRIEIASARVSEGNKE
jgi:D-citramalate synthase